MQSDKNASEITVIVLYFIALLVDIIEHAGIIGHSNKL